MRLFFDTNVLVYAHDAREPGKREISRALVSRAMDDDSFIVSTQVLVEFYATAVRRKLLAPAEARDLLSLWGNHDVVPQTADLVLRAVVLHQEHSLSFWDGLIVQAAIDAQCDALLSEDLQDGRRFGELVIRNPFSGPGLHEPAVRRYVARRTKERRR